MNKTLIALAIVAALPVAAQADATISGSVTTKYKNTGVIDTDASLSIASSEVLANGMTATATFAILADSDDDTENQGTASLAGDFGTLTAGSIDSDAAFQAGDVSGVVDDTTEGSSSTVSTVYGIHYAGTVAGLSVAAQANANTGAAGAVTIDKSTQMSATYDLNGLTVGYSYASGDSDADTGLGVNAPVTAFGVSYAFGDLAVTAGKASTSADALVSATYTMTADAITIVAQADNFHSATDKNDYQINLSYAMSDALTLSSEIDKNKTTTLVASYTSGDMTASVSKTDDGTTDASVALDFGNADLTLARNGGDADTSVTYKVAF
tara:strand:+ start:6975 stop:7949 length:975 start_codon:yes stop_codon:yes gene_type:complete